MWKNTLYVQLEWLGTVMIGTQRNDDYIINWDLKSPQDKAEETKDHKKIDSRVSRESEWKWNPFTNFRGLKLLEDKERWGYV